MGDPTPVRGGRPSRWLAAGAGSAVHVFDLADPGHPAAAGSPLSTQGPVTGVAARNSADTAMVISRRRQGEGVGVAAIGMDP